MNILPISALSTADGNLVSLSALRGTLSATPVPLDPDTAIGNFKVSTQQISVSVAAKVGIGSIFGSSVQANETGFWMDATQFADSGLRQDPNNIVTQTSWGYGLRILCRAQQLNASFNLNFALLGAAADLGLATVSYEIQTIGLGASALGAVLGGISQFGALNGETLHQLNTTVIQNVKKVIAAPPTALTPRPISVQLNIPVESDPIKKARSEVFAMRRIRDGMSSNGAVMRAGGKYDVNAVQAVYQQVAPGIGPNDSPDEQAQRFAKDWMG
jgi:hypothetical protein